MGLGRDLGASPHLIYLLHFARPVGRAKHYLGITRPSRLFARIDEHARGKGARLTARAAAAGVPLILAEVWPAATPHAERALKQNGHFNRLCPICRRGLDADAAMAEFWHVVPKLVSPPSWYDVGWR